MDVLEAHGRLALAQDRAGGPGDGEQTLPVVWCALADVSGALDDAHDDESLFDAVEHGHRLVNCGVIDVADVTDAIRDVFRKLEAQCSPQCQNS
jgi:hypothetical protein